MPVFRKQLAELERPARHDVGLALLEFTERFGKPHEHGGIGIRKMIPGIFECRAGLQLRIVVSDAPDSLRAEFIGNHDEIRRWIREM